MAYQVRDFNEEVEATEDKGTSNVTITRSMYVKSYTGGKEALADLLGGYRRIGNYIVRIPPMRHPLYTWCRCSKVNLKPFGGEPNFNYGSSTVITGPLGLARQADAAQGVLIATYTLPTFDEQAIDSGGQGGGGNEEKEVATETWDYGGNYITVKGDYLKWQRSGALVKNDETLVRKRIPEIDLGLVRHRVFIKPGTAITQLLGTVNYRNFNLLKENYPPETVMFIGASANRRLTAGGGLPFWEIAYKFKIQPIYDLIKEDNADAPVKGFVGWNRFFNPVKGWWERLVYKTNVGKSVYEWDDDQPSQHNVRGFDLLFSPKAI